VIILGENDRKPDGRWQRKDDAEAAASLKAQLRESPSDAVAIARIYDRATQHVRGKSAP